MTAIPDRSKTRPLVVVVLLVVSAAAAGVAFTGSAAAGQTGDLGNVAAGDVATGLSTVTQAVTFDAEIDGADAAGADGSVDETYELDLTSIPGTTPAATGVSTSGPDADAVTATLRDGSTATPEITVADDTADETAHAFTVTVTLTYDTTGVDAAADNPITISDTNGDAEDATATFALTDAADTTLHSGATYWDGQELVLSVPASVADADIVQVRSFDAAANGGDGAIGGLKEEVTLDANARTAVLDTSDYDGEFVITPADASSTALVFTDGVATATDVAGTDSIEGAFEVLPQELDVAFDAAEVTDEGDNAVTDVAFDSNRAQYSVNVSADGLDAATLARIFDAVPESDPIVHDGSHITLPNIQDGEYAADFADLGAGEYTFEFNATDTAASATDSMRVTVQDTDAEFQPGVSTATAGDIANFTVALEDTDSTYVQFGDEDAGFVDVLYLEDDDNDGEVTFRANMRTLGTDADKRVVYGSQDDLVESELYSDTGATFYDGDTDTPLDEPGTPFENYLHELGLTEHSDSHPLTQLTRPLQPADYELTVAANGQFIVNADGESTANEELDAALLDLNQPTLGNITINAAPEGSAIETTELDALTESVTVRDGGAVAMDDRLIVAVDASGLYGAVVAENDFDALHEGTSLGDFSDILANHADGNDWAGDGMRFEVTADDNTGNQPDTALNLDAGASAAYVVYDEDAGQFFVIADTNDGDTFDGDVEPNAEFHATMAYATDGEGRYAFFDDQVGAPYAGDAGGTNNGGAAYPFFGDDFSERLTASFTIAERSASFTNTDAAGVVQVGTSSDAELSGSTNIAPGSDAEVRLASTDANESFRLTEETEIAADGSFTASFDLSGQSPGDQAEATFHVDGRTIHTVDADLVDGPVNTTTTPTATAAPATTGTATPAPTAGTTGSTATTQAPDDESGNAVPGFGMAIAVVALLGAALLVVRQT